MIVAYGLMGYSSPKTSTMPHLQVPAIPDGSTVIVKVSNGYIGSHIVDKYLQFGFKVLGSVLDSEIYHG